MSIASDSPKMANGQAPASMDITFVITCKGRLAHLRRSLPTVVNQPKSQVVVVDFDCPEGTASWLVEHYPAVKIVKVIDQPIYQRSEAKNRGVAAVTTDWVCLLDADVCLDEWFVVNVWPLMAPDRILVSADIDTEPGVAGTMLFQKEQFDRVGGHDPVFQGWGEEDSDLIDAMREDGGSIVRFPAKLIRHIEHNDAMRMRFHHSQDRVHNHLVNRVYRSAKWDLFRLEGRLPDLDRRRQLYAAVRDAVNGRTTDSPKTITVDTGFMAWTPGRTRCQRLLTYQIELDS